MKGPFVYGEIDAPWDYNKRLNAQTRFGTGMGKYPGMSKDEILSLRLGEVMADNAALFFWVVAPSLRKNYVPLEIMFECFRAWGFRYVTKAFTWRKIDKTGKQRILPGHYSASNTEDCYLGIRGSLPVRTKLVPQIIDAEIERPHSRKPIEAKRRMKLMFGDVPRVEFFATRTFPGWTSWGNQVAPGRSFADFFGLPVNHPKRVQRSRQAGAMNTPGAIYCGRPALWSNPEPIAANADYNERREACRKYERELRVRLATREKRLEFLYSLCPDGFREADVPALSCWCPLYMPCHADVLCRMRDELIFEGAIKEKLFTLPPHRWELA